MQRVALATSSSTTLSIAAEKTASPAPLSATASSFCRTSELGVELLRKPMAVCSLSSLWLLGELWWLWLPLRSTCIRQKHTSHFPAEIRLLSIADAKSALHTHTVTCERAISALSADKNVVCDGFHFGKLEQRATLQVSHLVSVGAASLGRSLLG